MLFQKKLGPRLRGGDFFRAPLVEPLLFLAHRLPYPPNKGDKVRSYHFFAHLARRYRLFLGTFVDDPGDWAHVGAVRALCAEANVQPLARWSRPAALAPALLCGEPLTLPYFRSRALADWVRRVVERERISRALVFSSSMAQYAIDLPGLRTVVDFVDMDSAKWGAYAERRGWPARALYRREARRLLDYEKTVAARAAASLFVTDEETRRFVHEAPEAASRALTIRNGVDSAYYSPAHEYFSPFAPGERAVVFTGAMDYWPNVDAAVWFAREVLPLLRGDDTRVRFYVVGMNPDGAVRALAREPRVVITGRVPDVRPYLAHAAVVVAPLRVARGIQNKVLEAMAMAKPVVTTTACAAALTAKAGVELACSPHAQGFAAAVRQLFDAKRAAHMGALARARVLRDYTWAASLKELDAVLEPRAASAPSEALAL
jgi:polysaccharide biosynthesis protein PslH